MTNGFTGTGVSIIFYLLLAFYMPIAFLIRTIRHRSIHGARFVLRHFLYAVSITLTVWLGISYLTKILGLEGRGKLHIFINLGVRGVAAILLLWTLMPLFVQLWLKLRHFKPAQLPALTILAKRPQVQRPRRLAIDCVLPVFPYGPGGRSAGSVGLAAPPPRPSALHSRVQSEAQHLDGVYWPRPAQRTYT
jgi:hypothetical protein